MNQVDPGVVRARLDTVDITAARQDFPGMFAQWRAGEVRPFWIANAVRGIPGGAAGLAAGLGQHEVIVNGWGAGELYPGWDAVCAVAAAAGVTVAALEVPIERFVFPATGDHIADAATVSSGTRYHRAVIDAARPLRGNRLGLPATAEEAARVEAARKAAGIEALVLSYKQLGGQLSVSAPEDPLEAVIWTGHEPAIRAFQQALFTTAGDSTDVTAAHRGEQGAELQQVARERAATMPRLGPVSAVNEPGSDFLFTADFTAPKAWGAGANASGTVLTVSVSARRTGTDDRIPVTEAVRPWVRLLVGPAWAEKIVAVDMRAVVDANPLTAYFQVFLDDTGRAVDPPVALRTRPTLGDGSLR